jgi:hypothetical protein
MNHIKFFTYSIMLVLTLILSACASPATPEATSEPLAASTAESLVCPTTAPQDCLTASLRAPVLNEWRWGTTRAANYIITFEPGDKCMMEYNNPIDGNKVSYEIVVNDQTYQNYMVFALSLEEGKGYKDLEAYNAEGGDHNVDPPPWSDLQIWEIVSPMSRTWHGLPPYEGTLYFVCAVQGPEDQMLIETFDGINIPGE